MAKQALSTKDLQAGFGVGHMTIYNWRQGTATKDPLPCDVDQSGRVTFPVASTKAWAKKHGLEFNVPAEKAAESKPGPKAKIVKPSASTKIDRKKEPKKAAPVKSLTKSEAKRMATQKKSVVAAVEDAAHA